MNFKVKIKTLTSLFIGNGESYYPTDYYIDKKGKTLNFINKSDYLNKIYGGFSYRALMDLVSEGSFNFEQLMAIYTNSCKEDVIEYKIPIDDSHGNIHNSDSAFDYLTKNIKEPFRAPIDCFIRGGLDKLPYIPGSSFKGALKNAVQSYLLDKDENTVKKIKVELADVEKSFEHEQDPKKENKMINKKIAIVDKYVKRKLTGGFAIDEKIDTSTDFFRLIHVSDFVLSNYNNIKTDLNFVKIIRPNNLNKKSDEPTPMPVLLESICKNVSFEGEIYIDDNFIKSEFAKNMPILHDIGISDQDSLKKLLIDATKKFGSEIYDIESAKFKYIERLKFELDKNKNIFKIGRLAGGGSKSLNKIREITIKKNQKTITNKAEYQSSLWIDANNEPLGWIEIEFL